MKNTLLVALALTVGACTVGDNTSPPDTVSVEIPLASANDGTLGAVTAKGFQLGVGGGSLHLPAAALDGYAVDEVLLDLTASAGAEIQVYIYSLKNDGAAFGSPLKHIVLRGGHERMTLDMHAPDGQRLPWQDTLLVALTRTDVSVVLHRVVLVEDRVID